MSYYHVLLAFFYWAHACACVCVLVRMCTYGWVSIHRWTCAERVHSICTHLHTCVRVYTSTEHAIMKLVKQHIDKMNTEHTSRAHGWPAVHPSGDQLIVVCVCVCVARSRIKNAMYLSKTHLSKASHSFITHTHTHTISSLYLNIFSLSLLLLGGLTMMAWPTHFIHHYLAWEEIMLNAIKIDNACAHFTHDFTHWDWIQWKV